MSNPSRKSRHYPKSEGVAGALMMAMTLGSTMQPAESATSGESTRPSVNTPTVDWPAWPITKFIAQEKGRLSNAKLQGSRLRYGVPADLVGSEANRYNGRKGQDEA